MNLSQNIKLCQIIYGQGSSDEVSENFRFFSEFTHFRDSRDKSKSSGWQVKACYLELFCNFTFL